MKIKTTLAVVAACAASLTSFAKDADACLDACLDGYFAIQKALASDDLAAAQSAAAALEKDSAGMTCPAEMKAECCDPAAKSAQEIAGAKDLAAARAAFQALSATMASQAESHGPDRAVYKMHCPMAFKGKGGAWLQDSAELRNPYYGASMLKCGSQKGKIQARTE